GDRLRHGGAAVGGHETVAGFDAGALELSGGVVEDLLGGSFLQGLLESRAEVGHRLDFGFSLFPAFRFPDRPDVERAVGVAGNHAGGELQRRGASTRTVGGDEDSHGRSFAPSTRRGAPVFRFHFGLLCNSSAARSRDAFSPKFGRALARRSGGQTR